MKSVVLALVIALSAGIGVIGAATAEAGGPPGDALGFWSWLIDHSRPEQPRCCGGGGDDSSGDDVCPVICVAAPTAPVAHYRTLNHR